MATTGNERYLRYIMLLGKGGLLVLRGILERETVQATQSLKDILKNNRSLFNSLYSTQLIRLFPASTNDDVNPSTWDISLLHTVLRKLFWNRLQPNEQTLISDLKIYRNDTAHSDAMNMEENFYSANRSALEVCLRQLASGLGQTTIDAVDTVIRDTESGMIDIQEAMRSVRELNEYKEDILNALEETFNTFHSKMTKIEDMLEENKKEHSKNSQTLTDIETMQRHQHGDVLDVKENMNKLQETANVNKEMLQTLLTKMEIQTDKPGNKEKASKLLLDHIQHCLRVGGSRRDIDIERRIEEVVAKYPGLNTDLLEEVFKLLNEVYRNPDVEVGETTLGSVNMEIICSTIGGLLRHMEYMASTACKRHLRRISMAVNNILGIEISLSWNIDPGSLQSCLKQIVEKTKRTDSGGESKKIVLPLHCTSLKGLIHIWNLFEEGAANEHLVKISEILSKTVGAEVCVSTSVDLVQFTEAVYKAKQDIDEGCMPEDILSLDDSKNVIYKDNLYIHDILYAGRINNKDVLVFMINTIVIAFIALHNLAIYYELHVLVSLQTLITQTSHTLQNWTLLFENLLQIEYEYLRTPEAENSISDESEYTDASEDDESDEDETN